MKRPVRAARDRVLRPTPVSSTPRNRSRRAHPSPAHLPGARLDTTASAPENATDVTTALRYIGEAFHRSGRVFRAARHHT
ncbi:hypothetical protein, partial [Burkholderia sp. SIMBA_051]|uniref:hypothetical protein n=1 Tax=Burkholderia sp. SIMBA_051 TaxID=3085792 RepID=UPI00397A5A5A